MTKRYHYAGNMNIEHGGVLYSLVDWVHGYCDAVRVTPCSEAGGPDNMFWVEVLTINVPNDLKNPRDTPRRRAALATVGMDQRSQEWRTMSRQMRKHLLVQCCLEYGLYAQDASELVCIGPWTTSKTHPDFIPTLRLRAGTNLRSFARRQCVG